MTWKMCYEKNIFKFQQVDKRARIERIEMPQFFNQLSIGLVQIITQYYYYS